MRIQLGDGTSAEITSLENIDLDEQVVYLEGQRLTEARAAAIARDIRLPRELHDRLKSAADAAGLSESELAREAIDHDLAKGA